MTAAQPFRLYTQQEMRLFAQRVEAAARRWCTGWRLRDDGDLRWSLTPVQPASTPGGRWLCAQAPQQAVFSADHDLYALLSAMCWGQEKSQSAQMASPVAHAVLLASLSKLGGQLSASTEPLDYGQPAQPGSALAADYRATGALLVYMTHRQRRLSLILPPVLLASWLPARPPQPTLEPVPVGLLCPQMPINLRVLAQPTAVRVKELVSIRPGDVLRLDQQRDAPFALHLAQASAPLGAVEIGHCQGRSAAKIVTRTLEAPMKKGHAMTAQTIQLFTGDALTAQADSDLPSVLDGKLELLKDLTVQLETCLGRCETSLAALSQLKVGAVLTLDRAPADAVEILLSGRVVARGSLVVVGDYYGVRVEEISPLIA